MSTSLHPDESQLLACADGEAGSDVEQHVIACAECRDKVEQFRAAYATLAGVVGSATPPPPAPWADLRSRLNELDAGRVRRPRLQLLRADWRWVAAAAALVVAAVVIRFSTEQTVNAAELLRKAVAEEQRTTAPHIVRVKTGRGTTKPADPAVRALFHSANYDWDEPLSPRAFAKWRDSLAHKQDRINVLSGTEWGSGRFYRISTATQEGSLAQATITIRAADLHAVHERFEFRNEEFVEVSEGEPDVAPEPSRAPAPATQQNQGAPREITAADELRVAEALRAIKADLGEPVEIQKDSARGKIIVSVLAAAPERQKQLRSALAGLDFVELRVDSAEPVRAPGRHESATDTPEQQNTLHERLLAKLGTAEAVDNFTNHVMDLSETALSRAHALRALDERFPQDKVAQLSGEDRYKLRALVKEHALQLATVARTLYSTVEPLAPGGGIDGSGLTSGPGPDAWRFRSAQALAAAQALDRSITETVASPAPNADADAAMKRLVTGAASLVVRADSLVSELQ